MATQKHKPFDLYNVRVIIKKFKRMDLADRTWLLRYLNHVDILLIKKRKQ